MKYRTYILFYLVVAVLFSSIEVTAQETPDPGPIFPLGTWATGEAMDNATLYDSIDAAGFNWIVQSVNQQTKPFLEDFNIITQNGMPNEWIYYYSNGKYKKWEAERNDYAFYETGFKHPHPTPWGGGPYLYGGVETLTVGGEDYTCWATADSVTYPVDSILWGPNYTQEKNYKMIYNHDPIHYTARYKLALLNAPSNPQDTICKLYVRYRAYQVVNGNIEDTVQVTLDSLYLLAEDLPGDTFQVKSLHYIYPEIYQNPYLGPLGDYPNSAGEYYDDIKVLTGIEFCLDFWGKGKLYIDYVEVFDELIWIQWINVPSFVASQISTQLISYPPAEWPNLQYWYVVDEPGSIDDYEPMRIVDSLVYAKSNNTWHTINQFYPAWDGFRNGDTTIQKFTELVNPEKVMIDYFPFWDDETAEFGFQYLRPIFEMAAEYSPNFYYVPQGFGQFLETYPPFQEGNECGWRYPDSSELKASIFLALAHGAKGIHLWKFATNLTPHNNPGNCLGQNVHWKCLADSLDANYSLFPLGTMIKDNISPRLSGNLGQTLLTLNYTQDYINMKYSQGENPLPDQIWRYFTLNHYGNDYFWHAGFLQQNNFTDNDYVLLVNLREDGNRTASFNIENITYYENVSARNIEGGIGELDTTIAINSSITIQDEFPPGEGKLYQVAPVVKYGGRLIYDDGVNNETLYYDMIIENGATLTVNGDYTIKGDIIIKNGNIVTTGNGKMIFQDNKKLIIEGVANINGTPTQKLTLDFVSPAGTNGIVVDSSGSLNISYSVIKNAETGIKAELYANTLIAHYIDFVDCGINSINILGQTGLQDNPPQVKYCTISNSQNGISAANLTELIIQENYITNTDLGIYLSNVTKVVAFGNVITTNTEILPGIFVESTGGEIYTNIISGHTNGIHLGNSSPDIGGNDITGCKFHGMYVGSGSLPNMVGRLISNPNNHLWYPVSGYNKIYKNGGYDVQGGPPDDDGSEIYISNANVKMKVGCNSIYDDRAPSPPLEETELLMNGIGFFTISVKADSNHWGDTVYTARFGSGLNVDFEPYYTEACPLPDGGGEGKLVTKTSSGEPIDTLYPVERSVSALTENEILYSKAEKLFITGEIESAEVYYDQIISSNDTIVNKLEAYCRKYETGKLLQRNPVYFSELQNTYESLIQTTGDKLLKKIFGQLSKLCLVGQAEYVPAIGEFDNIVQQNPGSEEAVYAEIDALTTALLVEGNDSTLGKTAGGRYLVKTNADYTDKINEILRKNFGTINKTEEKEILPNEYTLYQNYPNPFNPVTTISYDLPKPGDVKLMIYDILGREVKTLINTQQEAGRHKLNFNASSLASGVYLYRLSINDFVSVKKMLLLK